jgi:uracil-DNA glycosylase family 4
VDPACAAPLPAKSAFHHAEPDHDCPRCPRLVAFRSANRAEQPDWFNAPVPTFGSRDAWLLIVGLAPGLRGANRTGRPFTGDFAGLLLYETLLACGLASGTYAQRTDDGLRLIGCAITNAVRCVPPQNKPLPAEIANCRTFLEATIAALPNLKAIVALGRIAHDSVVRALGGRIAALPFGHGREHVLPGQHSLRLFDSYHCSRYNTNTAVLTPRMFREVFDQACKLVPASALLSGAHGE